MSNQESRSVAIEHPEQLVAIGLRIRDKFSALTVSTLPQKELALSASSLENECQRFGLWATNLGLYITGHSSLEYRLGDAPSVYQYTKKALHDLENYLGILLQALKEVEKVCDDDVSDNDSYTDSDSEDFDTYDREPFTETALSNASRTIDRLYRIAFKIRNPATRIGFTKARNYQQIDQESGVDLIKAFSHFDFKHVQEFFLQYSPEADQDFADNFLVNRLAKSITRRRQQFKQWSTHRIKVETASKDASPFELIRSSNPARTGPIQQELLEVTPNHNVAISVPSSATRIDDAQINLEDTTSIISTSTYVRLSQQPEYSVEIPELPKKLRGEREFECPYCHILCSKRTAGAQAWKEHVLRDLRPYICTYEECRDGDQQYDTFKQWFAHEERSHRTARKCAEHVEETSYSESEWQKHINDHHGGDANISPSFIVEQKPVDVASTRQCPICPNGAATSEHVAVHLQQLALFALPRSTGLEDDTGSSNPDSAATNAELGQGDLDDLEKLSFSDTDPHNTKPQVYGVDFNNVGNYLGELDPRQLSADKWVEGEDWDVIFNPNLPRGGDIELVWQHDQQSILACVTFSKSGEYMAIGFNHGAIIYGLKNGEEISRLELEVIEKDCYVRDVCFDWEEEFLIAAAEDKLVRLYDISRGVVLRTYAGHEQDIYAVTISPDNTRIISCSGDHTVRVWRIDDEALFLTLAYTDGLTSVTISPNGQYLAAGSLDTTVAVFSIDGPLIRKLEGADKHTDSVYCARFTLDGQSLITGSLDKTIKLWNHLTGDVLRTFNGHHGFVLTSRPFQNDSIILSGSKDRTVMAWETQTGQALFLLDAHKNSVIGIDTHPTMGLFATASSDKTVKVWRYKNRR